MGCVCFHLHSRRPCRCGTPLPRTLEEERRWSSRSPDCQIGHPTNQKAGLWPSPVTPPKRTKRTHLTSVVSGVLFHKVRRTGGWCHLNQGGQARGNDWSGISGMVSNTPNTWFPWFPGVSMVSRCLMPFHVRRSGPSLRAVLPSTVSRQSNVT